MTIYHTFRGQKFVTQLYHCETEPEQVEWVADALRDGRSVCDISLWLGGVNRTIRVIGQAKALLRKEGIAVKSYMGTIVDAANEKRREMMWKREG